MSWSTPSLVFTVFIIGSALIICVRTQEDSNDILKYNPPDEIKTALPYFLSGVDKEGTPIWIFEFGRWDIRGLAEKGPEYPELIKKYTDQMFQRFAISPKEFGAQDFTLLVDMGGYDNRQFSSYLGIQQIINMARQFVSANGSTFKVKQVYIVNSNYLFQTAYNLIKPILGNLANNIELYGTNQEKWMPVLLKQIPKSQFPAWLGGSDSHTPMKVFG